MRLAFRLVFLGVLCASVANGFALNREAFTFTNYDLNVQVDPEQHRLGVRGQITLRNDSQVPQKFAVLQISSSLDWRSIEAGGKPLQFVSQPYTSDIDHTGALSEVIVTLPQPVAPKSSVELDVAYEGVIVLDATRLTRIGTPESQAESADWDQISANFTGVRGAGYVAWYPIATEAADLSEDDSLFEVLGRWKARESEGSMKLSFDNPSPGGVPVLTLCSGHETREATVGAGGAQSAAAQCSYSSFGLSIPAFVIAAYTLTDRPAVTVFSFPAHVDAANNFADAAGKAAPFIAEWFGPPREKARTIDLPDPNSAPFESGSLLLTPLASGDSTLAGMVAAHQLTHASFFSPRPWIDEGLALFAQALYLEREKGRQAALDYMGLHRSAFTHLEKQENGVIGDRATRQSLVNTSNEELYRSKAMCVWWMLRDMIGDAALKKALAAYRAADDKEPSYMPRLIQAQTQRDLEWFFDDWVYRDRGLPDFKIESVFPRKTLNGTYIVTITVDNLGTAGAEVPLLVKFDGGEITKRLEVRAKSKGVTRVETSAAPQEVTVNDGSVPESDMTNNSFKIASAEK